jgi:polyisoprenoid-binding protein YceI
MRAGGPILRLLARVLVCAAVTAAGRTALADTVTFHATGAPVTWTVPPGVTTIQVELQGTGTSTVSGALSEAGAVVPAVRGPAHREAARVRLEPSW